MQRFSSCVRFGRLLFRNRRIQFVDLSDLAAGQQHRCALFDSGGVVHVDLVGDERPEQPGCAKQDQDKSQHRDRRQDEQAGQDFISLQLHLCFLPEWGLRCCRSRTARPRDWLSF